MAIKRLIIDGYGQIEINNCAFRRDGRVEAHCAPDATDFSNKKVENGMILAVDAANLKVKVATDSSLPMAIVYTAEHQTDERKGGLKDFALEGKNDFYPRLGYLAVGDKFTTNCISYDSAKDSAFTDESAFKTALGKCATSALFGGAAEDGTIIVSATAPSFGPVLKVTNKTTMPNGKLGVKFQVIAD